MPRFRLEWKGVKRASRQLDATFEQIIKGLEAALFVEAEQTMTRAKTRFVPVDTGILRASGHVQKPTRPTPTSVEVELGFGGPAGAGNLGESNSEAVGYAVRVHENLETFGSSPGGGSRNTGPGAVRRGRPRQFVGQAKFLEEPLRERIRGMPARLARRLKRNIRKAVR